MPPITAPRALREPVPGLPYLEQVVLDSGAGLRAVFAPRAGMVGTSLQLDGRELLAPRRGLAGYLDGGHTFGLPLLAPWANRLGAAEQQVGGVAWEVRPGEPGVHPDEHGQAIHGLMPGLAAWEVEEAVADDRAARVAAVLRWTPALDRWPAFPFAHDLRVVAEVSDTVLRVTTSLTATGDGPVPVAFGWHPWFEFPDVPRAEWELHAPFRRRAVLSDLKIPTGEVVDAPPPDGPLGAAYLDDVFVDAADGDEVSVRAGSRRVVVRYVSGYPVGVLFAPLDVDVVCVEPMSAPTDPFAGRFPLRSAAPGTTASAVFEVVAERC